MKNPSREVGNPNPIINLHSYICNEIPSINLQLIIVWYRHVCRPCLFSRWHGDLLESGRSQTLFKSLEVLDRKHLRDTVGGRNPAPLYLHPKTNPRTPSLTLGLCLVVSKKEVEWPKSCTTSMTKDTQHWTWGYRGCTHLSKLYLLVLVQDFVHQPYATTYRYKPT